MKKILLILIYFTFIFFSFSEIFRFKYIKGQKYRIECTINGKQYIDNKLYSSYKQIYKTISEIINIRDNIASIQENYYYYNTNILLTNEIKELKDNIIVNYSKDSLGFYIIKNNTVLPVLRNVPVFPEQDIQIGYKWSNSGYEIQDLFNDKILSRFPINVTYEYLGKEIIDNNEYSKFKYEFNLNLVNNNDGSIDKRILKITGKSSTIMYFNNNLGERYKEIYSRNYIFTINDNYNLYNATFIDNGERIWYPIELMNKDNIVSELKKEIENNNIKDTQIEKDDKGVKISIENIQFEPESSVITKNEEDRLLKISNILKKYKDKGVLIIGHTTDKGTEKGREKLSLERAKSVLDFLLKQDSINKDKAIYYGKGGREPIADNNTEEGMKKNRRVEIFILEE